MNEINNYNIPAYRRKRSIAAKARSRRSNQTASITPRTTRTNQRSFTIEDLLLSDIPAVQQQTEEEDLSPPPTKKISINKIREMKTCGICEGYFDKINVAVIKVSSPIRTGDRIIFEKEDGLFEQTVHSIQINRKDVNLARSGSDIGIKIEMKPKVGTPVYKVIT